METIGELLTWNWCSKKTWENGNRGIRVVVEKIGTKRDKKRGLDGLP